jgi:hypothetical protein
MPLGYDGVMLVRAPSGCSQRHRRDMDTIGICEYPRMSKGAAGYPRVTWVHKNHFPDVMHLLLAPAHAPAHLTCLKGLVRAHLLGQS